MAGGVPIRIRRTMRDVPTDTPHLGEPFLNTVKGKFGVYDGTNMLWYPQVDPIAKKYILDQGMGMSGYDSGGNSTVKISYGTPNALEIRHTTGNTLLARFDQTGATFNNFVEADLIPGGTLNRLVHPGFIPQFFSATEVATNPGFGSWLGPNTYLWQKDIGTGSMSIRRDYNPGAGAITHMAAERFCLRAEVQSSCSGAGIRIWLWDPFLGYDTALTNKNKVFVSVWGELGKTSYLRCGRGGVYTYASVVGTGDWERVSVEVPAHPQYQSYIEGGSNEPFALDVLMDAEQGYWYVQEPTMQCIDQFTTEIYQYRSLTDRLTAANACWYEPAGINVFGLGPTYVNVPMKFPIHNDPYVVYDVNIVSSYYPSTISDMTEQGFQVTTTVVNSDYWAMVPKIALRGPLTDIA